MVGTEVIYLDTHVLIFLYLGEVRRLGAAARKAIDRDDAVASAASVLELEMLHEIGRLKPTASHLVATVDGDIGLAGRCRTEADGTLGRTQAHHCQGRHDGKMGELGEERAHRGGCLGIAQDIGRLCHQELR